MWTKAKGYVIAFVIGLASAIAVVFSRRPSTRSGEIQHESGVHEGRAKSELEAADAVRPKPVPEDREAMLAEARSQGLIK